MDTPQSNNQVNLEQDEDSRLVRAIIRGEVDLFSKLLAKYQNKVYYFLSRFFETEQDTLDVAQKSFLLAYEKLSQHDRKESFLAWLLKIARNQALNELKDKKRRAKLTFESKEEPPGGVDPELEAVKHDRAKTIRYLLDLLPAEQSQALVLRYIEALDYREIGEVLGVPQGTVMSRLSRGREKLGELIKTRKLEI
jgi:RNA polymerase sigma-70 factor, ECF subfamily